MIHSKCSATKHATDFTSILSGDFFAHHDHQKHFFHELITILYALLLHFILTSQEGLWRHG